MKLSIKSIIRKSGASSNHVYVHLTLFSDMLSNIKLTENNENLLGK